MSEINRTSISNGVPGSISTSAAHEAPGSISTSAAHGTPGSSSASMAHGTPGLNEMIKIPETAFIYRVVHRIMEGDCQYDHGPRPVTVGPFYASKYPVTNAMYARFLEESHYQPADPANYLKHWENGSFRPEDADCPRCLCKPGGCSGICRFLRLPSPI